MKFLILLILIIGPLSSFANNPKAFDKLKIRPPVYEEKNNPHEKNNLNLPTYIDLNKKKGIDFKHKLLNEFPKVNGIKYDSTVQSRDLRQYYKANPHFLHR